MENEKKLEDITEEEVSTSETEHEETEQDPLKQELDKVKGGRTEEEKASYTFRKQAERLNALGIDPLKALGMNGKNESSVTEEENEDDKPVTMGMLKKMNQESTSKSALELANEIQHESERELVKYHLQNTIRSTGNPQKDLELARSIVNAVKNGKVVEEIIRKPAPKTYSSNGGASQRSEPEIELSNEEQLYMKAPFFLTKEQIIASRQK